ncbi:MAG: helix-turn-helix domain-containing protein [Methanomicrobiales archaeon]|nr:helix-turn-helix domain-containing protein [Methanomicrobiales archaeon]
MFSRRIFEQGFRAALEEELKRQDISIKELSRKAGVPLPTLYKVTAGDRDVRFSTVQRVVKALEPIRHDFIAIIAVKFLLEEVEGQEIEVKGRSYQIRGYTANSIEECIVAAVKAEKEGAAGIVCAPVLASIVEKVVDIPVAIIKPKPTTVLEAIDTIAKRI